ncbi:hypothetical protein V496_00507 [Pseudogymnoascus sp. VKM F-4515 (FW-2607)]|nr:hypothetical protein V496_00507 [Pseudogymnoascus sp. VKM F-4515 (FW-2607)]
MAQSPNPDSLGIEGGARKRRFVYSRAVRVPAIQPPPPSCRFLGNHHRRGNGAGKITSDPIWENCTTYIMAEGGGGLLDYTYICHSLPSPALKVILSSVDAQIVSNEFLARFQTWTLVPWNRSDTFVEELPKNDNVMGWIMYNICVHDKRAQHGGGGTVIDLMIFRVGQLEVGKNCQTRIFQCPYCYVDYMVDAKDFGERGFAVITTKWVNFGAGLESPDVKWESHPDRYLDRVEVDRTADHPERIRADFENQAELSLEDLTDDNERKLFSTRKHRPVTRAPDGCVWR